MYTSGGWPPGAGQEAETKACSAGLIRTHPPSPHFHRMSTASVREQRRLHGDGGGEARLGLERLLGCGALRPRAAHREPQVLQASGLIQLHAFGAVLLVELRLDVQKATAQALEVHVSLHAVLVGAEGDAALEGSQVCRMLPPELALRQDEALLVLRGKSPLLLRLKSQALAPRLRRAPVRAAPCEAVLDDAQLQELAVGEGTVRRGLLDGGADGLQLVGMARAHLLDRGAGLLLEGGHLIVPEFDELVVLEFIGVLRGDALRVVARLQRLPLALLLTLGHRLVLAPRGVRLHVALLPLEGHLLRA
mmetsp:Transcript_22501/g.66305  ORF Transcript_22501/g.66305 Transcript_22501/m.66305 type:complete len:306 (-) Transcript_22501:985-1902(-)